ncbi:MAG: gamma-glutamyl-gamma-aminobutyrate hydrolase family protein [Erysipelotrichaceae bacterium]|jgi:putative glutamine amidotransferase|nr:gamma-glutamyl-gamma-aminobutyrate hydrolase family protein [Erysipelotrichaceae bacterium]
MKPNILITSRRDRFDSYNLMHTMNDYLVPFLEQANTYLSGFYNAYDMKDIVSRFDGLVVAGGGDVDPFYYNQENRASKGIDTDIDETDLLLIQNFAKVNKPILGICRGIQIINVAFGGTLIQDIPTEYPTTLHHAPYMEEGMRKLPSHTVAVEAGTLAHSLLGSGTLVNSFHHQAIDELAPEFIVSATAEDGLIETIERGNILAVQWHPERLQKDPDQRALFAWLIQAATEAMAH